MTKEEFTNIVQSEKSYNLSAIDIRHPEVSRMRVATGKYESAYKDYTSAINVYKCDDGVLGVMGPYRKYSESIKWEDLKMQCTIVPIKEVHTITYVIDK